MFHIPFDKVHLVNNQRFSLSGYPCLYLANSSYCCWEELNRPDLERCNFSVYATTRNLNIFDLTTPLEIKSADDLLRFPLILSCSISITPENAAFKPEYILPQALFQCVIRFNNMKISKVHLDGILYLSTKVGDRIFFKDEDIMANFVFPTVNRNSNAKFCSKLADMFVVSEAVTYQELWFKYPHLVTQQDEDWSAKDGFYELSIFRKIEKFAMGKTIPKSKIVV